MSKYYQVVKASERPKEEGWYKVTLEGDVHTEALFSNDEWSHDSRGGDVIEWLEPISTIPDNEVERLREAIERIAFCEFSTTTEIVQFACEVLGKSPTP